jgi:hypothetical protein
VLATVGSFLDAWDKGERDQFNAAISRRYEGIRDYLVCHYRTAQRKDTDYWRDATTNNNLSDSLKGVINSWFRAQNLEEEVNSQDIAGYYSPISWHCMLAGYGNFPPPDLLKPPGPDITPLDMAEVERFVSGCAMNFPPLEEALERLKEAA